jgi:hypothetical protein
MLRLLRFAARVESRPQTASGTEHAVADAIFALANVEAHGTVDAKGPTLTSKYFEDFMAHWLHLISIIRADETLCLLDLFHAEKLDVKELPETSPLRVKFKLRPLKFLPRFQHQFNPEQLHAHLGGGKTHVVTSFGGDNPAFDVLMTAPCVAGEAGESGGYMAVAVETRLSDVGSSAQDTDLTKKKTLFDSSQKVKLESLEPAPAHIAYVYAAVRQMASAAKTQKDAAKEGVLVLCDRFGDEPDSLASIRRALGPSLTSRGFFIVNLKEQRLLSRRPRVQRPSLSPSPPAPALM